MNNEKGSALLIVMILTGATFVIATLMMGVTVDSKKDTDTDLYKQQSYYCADAGIIDMTYYLYENQFNVTASTTISNKYNNNNRLYNDIKSSYSVILETNPNYTEGTDNEGRFSFRIKSVGVYKDKQCIIIADITAFTIYDGDLNKYIIDMNKCYIVNNKKVFYK